MESASESPQPPAFGDSEVFLGTSTQAARVSESGRDNETTLDREGTKPRVPVSPLPELPEHTPTPVRSFWDNIDVVLSAERNATGSKYTASEDLLSAPIISTSTGAAQLKPSTSPPFEDVSPQPPPRNSVPASPQGSSPAPHHAVLRALYTLDPTEYFAVKEAVWCALLLVCPMTTSRMQPHMYLDGWFLFKCDHNAEYALQLENEADSYRPTVIRLLAEFARMGTYTELARHVTSLNQQTVFHAGSVESARQLVASLIKVTQVEAQDVPMRQVQVMDELLSSQQRSFDTWKAEFNLQHAQLRENLHKARQETTQARADATRAEQALADLQDSLAIHAQERQQLQLALDKATRELTALNSGHATECRTPPPGATNAYPYPSSAGDVFAMAHNTTNGTMVTQSGAILRTLPLDFPGIEVPVTPQQTQLYQKGLTSAEQDTFNKSLPPPEDPDLDLLEFMNKLQNFGQHTNGILDLPDLFLLSDSVEPKKREAAITQLVSLYQRGTLLAAHHFLKRILLVALPPELMYLASPTYFTEGKFSGILALGAELHKIYLADKLVANTSDWKRRRDAAQLRVGGRVRGESLVTLVLDSIDANKLVTWKQLSHKLRGLLPVVPYLGVTDATATQDTIHWTRGTLHIKSMLEPYSRWSMLFQRLSAQTWDYCETLNTFLTSVDTAYQEVLSLPDVTHLAMTVRPGMPAFAASQVPSQLGLTTMVPPMVPLQSQAQLLQASMQLPMQAVAAMPIQAAMYGQQQPQREYGSSSQSNGRDYQSNNRGRDYQQRDGGRDYRASPSPHRQGRDHTPQRSREPSRDRTGGDRQRTQGSQSGSPSAPKPSNHSPGMPVNVNRPAVPKDSGTSASHQPEMVGQANLAMHLATAAETLDEYLHAPDCNIRVVQLLLEDVLREMDVMGRPPTTEPTNCVLRCFQSCTKHSLADPGLLYELAALVVTKAIIQSSESSPVSELLNTTPYSGTQRLLSWVSFLLDGGIDALAVTALAHHLGVCVTAQCLGGEVHIHAGDRATEHFQCRVYETGTGVYHMEPGCDVMDHSSARLDLRDFARGLSFVRIMGKGQEPQGLKQLLAACADDPVWKLHPADPGDPEEAMHPDVRAFVRQEVTLCEQVLSETKTLKNGDGTPYYFPHLPIKSGGVWSWHFYNAFWGDAVYWSRVIIHTLTKGLKGSQPAAQAVMTAAYSVPAQLRRFLFMVGIAVQATPQTQSYADYTFRQLVDDAQRVRSCPTFSKVYRENKFVEFIYQGDLKRPAREIKLLIPQADPFETPEIDLQVYFAPLNDVSSDWLDGWFQAKPGDLVPGSQQLAYPTEEPFPTGHWSLDRLDEHLTCVSRDEIRSFLAYRWVLQRAATPTGWNTHRLDPLNREVPKFLAQMLEDCGFPRQAYLGEPVRDKLTTSKTISEACVPEAPTLEVQTCFATCEQLPDTATDTAAYAVAPATTASGADNVKDNGKVLTYRASSKFKAAFEKMSKVTAEMYFQDLMSYGAHPRRRLALVDIRGDERFTTALLRGTENKGFTPETLWEAIEARRKEYCVRSGVTYEALKGHKAGALQLLLAEPLLGCSVHLHPFRNPNRIRDGLKISESPHTTQVHLYLRPGPACVLKLGFAAEYKEQSALFNKDPGHVFYPCAWEDAVLKCTHLSLLRSTSEDERQRGVSVSEIWWGDLVRSSMPTTFTKDDAGAVDAKDARRTDAVAPAATTSGAVGSNVNGEVLMYEESPGFQAVFAIMSKIRAEVYFLDLMRYGAHPQRQWELVDVYGDGYCGYTALLLGTGNQNYTPRTLCDAIEERRKVHCALTGVHCEPLDGPEAGAMQLLLAEPLLGCSVYLHPYHTYSSPVEWFKISDSPHAAEVHLYIGPGHARVLELGFPEAYERESKLFYKQPNRVNCLASWDDVVLECNHFSLLKRADRPVRGLGIPISQIHWGTASSSGLLSSTPGSKGNVAPTDGTVKGSKRVDTATEVKARDTAATDVVMDDAVKASSSTGKGSKAKTRDRQTSASISAGQKDVYVNKESRKDSESQTAPAPVVSTACQASTVTTDAETQSQVSASGRGDNKAKSESTAKGKGTKTARSDTSPSNDSGCVPPSPALVAHTIGLMAELNAAAHAEERQAALRPRQQLEDQSDNEDLGDAEVYYTLKHGCNMFPDDECSDDEPDVARQREPKSNSNAAQRETSSPSAAVSAGTKRTIKKYHLDSGANNHFFQSGIVSDSRWLKTVGVRTSKKSAVVVADSFSHHEFQVSGYEIKESGEDSVGQKTLRFDKVTHSPHLTCDLISVSALARQYNATIVFTADGGAVLFGQATFFLRKGPDGVEPFQIPITQEDGLYHFEPEELNGRPIVPPTRPSTLDVQHAHTTVESALGSLTLLHTAETPCVDEPKLPTAGTPEEEGSPLPLLPVSETDMDLRPLQPYESDLLPTPERALDLRFLRAWARLTCSLKFTYAHSMDALAATDFVTTVNEQIRQHVVCGRQPGELRPADSLKLPRRPSACPEPSFRQFHVSEALTDQFGAMSLRSPQTPSHALTEGDMITIVSRGYVMHGYALMLSLRAHEQRERMSVLTVPEQRERLSALTTAGRAWQSFARKLLTIPRTFSETGSDACPVTPTARYRTLSTYDSFHAPCMASSAPYWHAVCTTPARLRDQSHAERAMDFDHLGRTPEIMPTVVEDYDVMSARVYRHLQKRSIFDCKGPAWHHAFMASENDAVSFQEAARALPRRQAPAQPSKKGKNTDPPVDSANIGFKTLREVTDTELAWFLVNNACNLQLDATWYPDFKPYGWTVRPTSMGSKTLKKGGDREVYVRCFFVKFHGPLDMLPDADRDFQRQYVDIMISANTFAHAKDLHVRGILKGVLKDTTGVPQSLNALLPSATQTLSADSASQGVQTEPMHPQREDTVYAQTSISWGEPRVAVSDLRSIHHQRLAHAGERVLKYVSAKHKELRIPAKYDSTASSRGPRVKCVCCMENKATIGGTFPLGNPQHKAKRFLGRVCMDFSGELQIPAYNGARYFMVFVDEYTDYTWVYFAKSRAEAPDILRRFLVDAHAQTDQRLGILRTDNAGEFLSHEFHGILQKHSVKLECCSPYAHHQNGKAERTIRLITEKARCMMNHAKCPRDFWAWAVRHAVFVHNRLPVEGKQQLSPFERVHGYAPDLSMLRVFGCSAVVAKGRDSNWVHDSKWDSRGVPGVFIGIATDGHDISNGASIKGWVVWTLATGSRLLVTTDVTFDEQVFPRLLGPIEWELSEARGGKTTLKPSPLHKESQSLDLLPFEVTAEEINMCAKQLPRTSIVGCKVYKRNEDSEEEEARAVRGTVSGHNNDGTWDVTYDSHNGQVTETVDVNDLFDSKKYLFAKQEAEDHDILAAFRAVVDDNGLPYQPDTSPIMVKFVEPNTYKQAAASSQASQWLQAIREEVEGLVSKDTWEVVRPIPGVVPIPSRWVFKVKYAKDHSVERFKARFVVRGDKQREGIDFGEVFSAVSHNTIARMLLSIACSLDLEVDLVDVTQAFLNADIDSTVYVKPAQGVTDVLGVPADSWLKLKKSLYGLRQAPRNWSQEFMRWLKNDQGFEVCSQDDCLWFKEFMYKGKKTVILVLTYVDDDLIISNNREALDAFKAAMNEKYKIVDKGQVDYYLGVEISRDRVNRRLTLKQSKFIREILKTAHISEKDPRGYCTPLPANLNLFRNTEKPLDRELYQSLVGSLIYLSTWTRPDIAYAVSELSKHMQSPSKAHHVALKHVLVYLSHTIDLGITYSRGDVMGLNTLYGFSDANFAGDPDTRRSKTGWLMRMNNGPISWKSKDQSTVALSTCDAEVFAAVQAVKEIKYLRYQLHYVGLTQEWPTRMFVDNQATIAIMTRGSLREETKHIGLRKGFLRENYQRMQVQPVDCSTKNQLADIFTKSLPKQSFVTLRDIIMGHQCVKDAGYYVRKN